MPIRGDSYRFRPGAAYLLSLLSGVRLQDILDARVYLCRTGIRLLDKWLAGRSVVTGRNSKSATITHFYHIDGGQINGVTTNPLDFDSFMWRNAHEVGHIPQLNGTCHILGSIMEYARNVISGYDWHDGPYSIKEHDADRGSTAFLSFRDYIAHRHGTSYLKSLFQNHMGNQDKLVSLIGELWINYYADKSK